MIQASNELKNFLSLLERGELRAATIDSQGNWVANQAVKENILNVFRNSKIIKFEADVPFGQNFIDKELYAPRDFQVADQVRLVPGGTSVRAGAFVGKGVVIMPPAYINVGAYVDEGTMIDSHVLVGSCAQIGKRVHLSAAVQIGGVLEPIGQRPVIVEDDCFIGANVILTEGLVVRSRAVLAAGVCLSSSVPIYDCVNEKIIFGEIPPGAVVVPGSRPCQKGAWGSGLGLNINCALIVKYRDEKTSHSVALESALR
ncbi:MAG: 2,3,4,5-tetrahydropyridine-2,6-dicarboxylate N-succinyltransferase [Bacteriovoracaceae bacterium]|nr:2,3,4,5-tetrahydropyridine-2,6-dicarboxylate N-succinyltransferase [Bacteriovoracaceae bacterium]